MNRLQDGARPTTRVCEAVSGPESIKVCRVCGEHKAYADLIKAKTCVDGVSNECVTCHSARSAANYEDNRDARRASIRATHLRRRYGLTESDVDAMLASQDNRCAICADVFTGRPHIDHCHNTGAIRALLCGLCNRGIGYLKDNPAILRAGAAYIELHHSAQ